MIPFGYHMNNILDRILLKTLGEEKEEEMRIRTEELGKCEMKAEECLDSFEEFSQRDLQELITRLKNERRLMSAKIELLQVIKEIKEQISPEQPNDPL